MIRIIYIIIAALLSITAAAAQYQASEFPAGSVKVLVKTTAGDFTLLLYGDTPGHRDNFLKIVNDHGYDSVLFHRVIDNFMIQAGDPASKNAAPGQSLGSSQIGQQIAAEIVYPRHYHKRGALCAARSGDAVNPERKSSGSQFYIVTGQKFTDSQLDQIEMNQHYQLGQKHFNALAMEHREEILKMQSDRDTLGLKTLQNQLAEATNAWLSTQDTGMPPEVRKAYIEEGGAPHLDNEYTVYGEVIQGMDVIDRIQKVETDSHDRPLQDVRILSMKILD